MLELGGGLSGITTGGRGTGLDINTKDMLRLGLDADPGAGLAYD